MQNAVSNTTHSPPTGQKGGQKSGQRPRWGLLRKKQEVVLATCCCWFDIIYNPRLDGLGIIAGLGSPWWVARGAEEKKNGGTCNERLRLLLGSPPYRHLCNGSEEYGEVLRASADFISAVHRTRWLGR